MEKKKNVNNVIDIRQTNTKIENELNQCNETTDTTRQHNIIISSFDN